MSTSITIYRAKDEYVWMADCRGLRLLATRWWTNIARDAIGCVHSVHRSMPIHLCDRPHYVTTPPSACLLSNGLLVSHWQQLSSYWTSYQVTCEWHIETESWRSLRLLHCIATACYPTADLLLLRIGCGVKKQLRRKDQHVCTERSVITVTARPSNALHFIVFRRTLLYHRSPTSTTKIIREIIRDIIRESALQCVCSSLRLPAVVLKYNRFPVPLPSPKEGSASGERVR